MMHLLDTLIDSRLRGDQVPFGSSPNKIKAIANDK